MLSAPSGKATCQRSSPSRALEASKYAESQDIRHQRVNLVACANETSQVSARVVASKKNYDLELQTKSRKETGSL